jgi:DNA-binding transcriptional regulator LsrR (DeoR family)
MKTVPAKAGIVVSGDSKKNERGRMNKDTGKQAAARAALEFGTPGRILGVGTGSTVNFLIDELAAQGVKIAGAVSSSNGSTQRLQAAGRNGPRARFFRLGGASAPTFGVVARRADAVKIVAAHAFHAPASAPES